MNNNQTLVFHKNVAYNGAVVAVAAVFAYSIMVMMYVLIRISSTIYTIMPKVERTSILWANGFTVAYSIAVFSLLMAVFSTATGVMAAVILKKNLLYFNPESHLKKAILISFITALTLITLIYFLLCALLKDWMVFNYFVPFLFWFLFPAAIFLLSCVIGGSQLNNILKR